MTSLNLKDKKVTKSTSVLIRNFIRENYKSLSVELLNFYDLVAGLVEIQLRKKKVHRMDMQQILDRSYNFEEILISNGCVGLELEKIN